MTALCLIATLVAGDATTELGTARQLYDELRYNEAAAAVDQALASGDLSARAILEAYRLLGTIEVIRENPVRARSAFLELFARDPNAELVPEESPKVASFFARVHQEFRQRLASGGPAAVTPGCAADKEPSPASDSWIVGVVGAAVLGVGLGVLVTVLVRDVPEPGTLGVAQLP